MARGARGLFGRFSLRTWLLFDLVGMLALLCVVVAVPTELALRTFLLEQTDQKLTAASGRVAVAYQHPPLAPPDPTGHDRPLDFLLGATQELGTIGAMIENGKVTEAAQLTLARGQPELAALPTPDRAALTRPVPGAPPESETLAGLGDYRLVATRLSGGRVLVMGLPLRAVDATMLRLGLVLATVSATALILAGLGSWAILRVTLRPLRRVAQTATEVAALPLDRGEVALPVRVPELGAGPHTEVGQLAAALNRMLAHIAAALRARHASETRVLRFAADASHELRTPLTAIRGYVEVANRSRADVSPEVAHALDRVGAATDRMTALVEDLLLLARLDAGPEPVRRPTDLSRLVVETVADAHVVAPDHVWHLELPERAVVVSGDPEQLRRVVTNVLSNARLHTPGGTTVTAGVAAVSGRAVFTVTDDGPGIPVGLQSELFERFTRGDTSRSRSAGSTGLGLAIVGAVVAAHAGAVEVESRPGRTRFAVTLPSLVTEPGTGG